MLRCIFIQLNAAVVVVVIATNKMFGFLIIKCEFVKPSSNTRKNTNVL